MRKHFLCLVLSHRLRLHWLSFKPAPVGYNQLIFTPTTNEKDLFTDIEVKTVPLTHGHMISPIYKQLCTANPNCQLSSNI